MKIFRIIRLVFIGIILFLTLIFTVIRPDVEIKEFDATITLDENGDMTVVERWDMTYNEAMRVRFRDIKTNKYADNYPLYEGYNNTASLDETDISARFYRNDVDKTSLVRIGYSFENDLDEQGYPVACEPDSYGCESIFIDTRYTGGLHGDVSFVYIYKIIGAVTKYSDISELNWRLFEYAESKIEHATITINMPSNTYGTERFYIWGHGLSDGTLEIVSNTQVVLEMNNIKSGEFPEFRLLMPNLLFPTIHLDHVVIHSEMNLETLLEYEAYLAEQTNRRILIANIVLATSVFMVVFMGVYTYRVYIRFDKEYEPEFKGDFFRDLPNEDSPAVVSYLYYEKRINSEVFTATLLDLIRRDCIKLEYETTKMSDNKADFILKRSEVEGNSKLKAHEKMFLEFIFNVIGDGKMVTTKLIENYGKKNVANANKFQSKTAEFVTLSKRVAEKQNYFENQVKKHAVISTGFLVPLIMFIVSLLSAWIFSIDNLIPMMISGVTGVSFLIYVSTIKKRSVLGNELYVKWKGFKNFLETFSNMEDYPIPALIVWEHYLVYATVFGIADKVMSQLYVKLPESEFLNDQSSYLRYSYMNRMRSNFFIHTIFRNSFTTARNNAVQTIARHNASTSGRGGGFGGGSSFGGGGGGGRSR